MTQDLTDLSRPVTQQTITQRLAGAPLRDWLLDRIAAQLQATGSAPQLVIVQVGDDARSAAYIRHKLAACARTDIVARVEQLAPTTREAELHAVLTQLGQDPAVHAIVAQTPLMGAPEDGWNVQAALDLVPPLKDCDGLSSANKAKLLAGDPTALVAATPLGVLRLLTHPELGAGLVLAGQKVAVIGNGLVVGRPLRALLRQQAAEVIGIDKTTPDPAGTCRQAGIVCAAAGVAGLVTREWLQEGAVVVDIGLTSVEIDGRTKLRGDVAAAGVQGRAKVLTPVPGGVGPLTVASLLTNVVDGWLMQCGEERGKWH